MKKILIIMLFTVMFNVYALEGNVSVECEKTTLKPGDITNCTIKGNTTGEVSGVDMKLIVTENLEILDLVKNASWEMGDVEDNHISLFTAENKIESFNIATFKIKAKDITEDATESVSLIDVSLSVYVLTVLGSNTSASVSSSSSSSSDFVDKLERIDS